ncbi:MAG: hypothetical protein JSU86_17825 [Phycisphaerales bacterium]|nr:MAG: hypothetical protein JSU86_17825 [Phycisphaerales bacterium]
MLRRSEAARSWVAVVTAVMGGNRRIAKAYSDGQWRTKEGDQAWGVFRVAGGPCRPGG